jgi:hypothetical protein
MTDMKKIYLIIVATLSCVPFLSYSQTCGSTNIAFSRPVNVSNQQEYHSGSDAVDGNLGTAWFATGDTNYISVDLGQSYALCKIKVNWFTNGLGKNYLAQVSTDEINWTTIYTRTNNNSTSDSFNVTGNGRYLRIYVTAKVNSWASLEMAELRIYNSLAGNTKPSVSLTAPANNASFYSGSNITLTASASDPDGSVTKVEFYQGAEKLGEALSAPYSFVWSNVQAGNYALTAKAYDNTNADSTSAAVNIVVNPTTRWSLQGNAGTNPDTTFLGTTDNKRLVFKTNNLERITILGDGFVGIGTSAKPNPEALLGVEGAIYARKLKVTQTGWADFVFNKGYKLPTLKEVEAHIKKYNHLPGIPSEAEVKKNGTDVAEIQALLLKKIEELTLYVIEQNKKLEAQQQQIEVLKKKTGSNQ